MGVTPTAAASQHNSPHRSSHALPVAGQAAKKNPSAVYKVSTGPKCQIVVVFDEPPVRHNILQPLGELQQAARNQQSSVEFTGWGTRTLTITVRLTAATALIKALEHFIVEILKIRVAREITLKVGDKEVSLKGTNDIDLARQTLEQLQERRVILQ
jgi:hypothetical protein